MSTNKSVIVYGPHNCGKTNNAERIATYLGLPQIVDDWTADHPTEKEGHLYLTNCHVGLLPSRMHLLSFGDVMAQMQWDATEPEPKRAPDILLDAASAIDDRAHLRDQVGGERSMARTVAAFNAVHGTSLTELQGWNFMLLLKIARSTAGRVHVDDYTDMAGYAGLAGECAQHVIA